jgi:HD superfamily phosphohydrolase
MGDVFRYLDNEISNTLNEREATPADANDVQLETLRETSRLAKALAEGVGYRPMQAKLFGELQDTRLPAIHGIWKRFCIAFLNGTLTDGPASPMAGLKCGSSHETLADLYTAINALVLSFNFDGLTYKALRDRFYRSRDRVYILDEPHKVTEFYGRDPSTQSDWAVWKIRGDVFFATCRESGCPSRGASAPLYALTRRRPNQVSNPEIPNQELPTPIPSAEDLLACPECGTQRSLRIAFPGLEQKERETTAMVRELWRYVVPSLSGIVIIGLSGVWDEAVIRSLFAVAACRRIPVLDVKPRGDNERQKADNDYIEQLYRVHFPTIAFGRVYATAPAFLNNFKAIAEESQTPPGLAQLPSTPPNTLPTTQLAADNLWADNDHFAIPFPTGTRGSAAPHTVSLPSTADTLAYHLADHPDVKRLRAYSQLGLKNYWWGRDSFMRHNRYLHSLGSLRVSALWHQALRDSIASAVRPARTKESLDREADLLMIAALLHDYGHLPFSHLFEEVFAELNWSENAPHGKYSHLDAGTTRVASFLEKGQIQVSGGSLIGIRDCLKDLGYSIEDVITLIRGETGVGYLDAIINSPIDADKIDYIFRDSSELNLGVRLLPSKAWLTEFLIDQDVSSEGMIRLNGRSAIRLLELLETRQALYRDFYLAPWIRAMEALAANVIVKFVLLTTSETMMRELTKGTLPQPDPDWGSVKINVAARRLEEEYDAVKGELRSEQRLEQPLLMRIVDELESGDWTQAVDIGYRKEFLAQIRRIFSYFDPSASGQVGDTRRHGETLRYVYQHIHLAGPFRVAKSSETLLREIVREVQLLYPDKVVFALAAMPGFLSTAEGRRYGIEQPCGENVLVPCGGPANWTLKSDARVPIHNEQFREFEDRHLEVVLVDPWEGGRLAGRYVLDVFRRRCRQAGVVLNE